MPMGWMLVSTYFIMSAQNAGSFSQEKGALRYSLATLTGLYNSSFIGSRYPDYTVYAHSGRRHRWRAHRGNSKLSQFQSHKPLNPRRALRIKRLYK